MGLVLNGVSYNSVNVDIVLFLCNILREKFREGCFSKHFCQLTKYTRYLQGNCDIIMNWYVTLFCITGII